MTDRGVSVTVNYVLGLAVTTVLITGLLYGTGDVVGDTRESVIRGELRVVGEQVAADLMAADRLARTGADEVTLRVSTPSRIGGRGYDVSLNASSRHVVVETGEPLVRVRVPFRNTTPVETSTASGREVLIVLDGTGSLEVTGP